MILELWIVCSPKMSRPYTSVSEPTHLDRSDGTRLFKLVTEIPDRIRPDEVLCDMGAVHEIEQATVVPYKRAEIKK